MHEKDILHFSISRWEKLAMETADTEDKIICLGNRMALQFQPKAFVSLVYLSSLWRSLNKVNHKLDGLIFCRVNQTVQTGTDPMCFKWKAHHTIDLVIEGKYLRGKWNYTLYFQGDQILLNCAEHTFSCVSDLSISGGGGSSGGGGGGGNKNTNTNNNPNVTTDAGTDDTDDTNTNVNTHPSNVVLSSSSTNSTVGTEKKVPKKTKQKIINVPKPPPISGSKHSLVSLNLKLNTILQATSKYFGDINTNNFCLIGEFVCEIDPTQPIVWCEVQRWRKDKQTASHYDVIVNALVNLYDVVSIDELLQIVDKQTYYIGKLEKNDHAV